MPLIVLTFVLFSFSIASASQWMKTFGGSDDWAFSIQQTSDGGYIVAGQNSSFGAGAYDAWVLKLDGNGDVQWQKTYGGSNDDSANSIQQTSDGGYIVAGWTRSFGVGRVDAWVLKLDGNGDVQWQKTYGGSNDDSANSIQQTSDGGYILAGSTAPFDVNDIDAWILKLDGNGDVQWQKTYFSGISGIPGYEYASSIQQTSDGGYIVAGTTVSFGAGNQDAWVLKIDGSGNVQWQKTYGGTKNDWTALWTHSIQQTSDGGYIVAGITVSFGAGNQDAWVLKLDGNGNVQWQKTYGGASYDYAYSIQQTSDGGYIVAGQTRSFGGTGTDNAWVFKLDGSGNVEWQKTYGGSSHEYANFIQQTPDGGYIVAGSTLSFGAGFRDAWILKLDGNGNINNCSIIKTSNAQIIDTNVTAQDTNDIGVDSNVSPQTSTASVSDTNAVVTEFCKYGCNLVPDVTTIHRGGTLGFQATGTNYTDNTDYVLFTTKVRLPNGNMYPSSGYLFGPLSFYLSPYQSKSKHLSQAIPSNAPLGWYSYHGYVGNFGMGNYSECTFDFEVIEYHQNCTACHQ